MGLKASRAVAQADQGERIPLSTKQHFLNLFWAVFPASVCLLIAVGAAIACLVMILNGPGVKEWIALGVLVLVVGFCLVFFLAFVPTIRLFLFSVRPGGYYLLTQSMLQRYAADNRLIEQIPFANIARVRLATATSGMDQETRYRVIKIKLKNLEESQTTLDPYLHRWSRKTQGQDIALIEGFFDVPLKSVYQKIKKHWRINNKDASAAEPDEDVPLV